MASLPEGSTPQASPPDPMNWGAMGELLGHDFSGIGGFYSFGPFHSATNGYAAVRFSSPAGLHYGWIQFTNAAPDQPPAVARFAAEPRVNIPLEIGRVIEDTDSTRPTRPSSASARPLPNLRRVRHAAGEGRMGDGSPQRTQRTQSGREISQRRKRSRLRRYRCYRRCEMRAGGGPRRDAMTRKGARRAGGRFPSRPANANGVESVSPGLAEERGQPWV
jgi:hypothetical protein